jgi:hypothetical protein
MDVDYMLLQYLGDYLKNQQTIHVFIRDQQRWIENALITELKNGIVSVCYTTLETKEDNQLSSEWVERIRIESIGSVAERKS